MKNLKYLVAALISITFYAIAPAQFLGPPTAYGRVDSDTLSDTALMIVQVPKYGGSNSAKVRSITMVELAGYVGGNMDVGSAIQDSLASNGIGDSATANINARVYIANGNKATVAIFGNSLCNFPGSPSGNYYDTLTRMWNFTQNNLCVAGAFMEDSNIVGRVMQFSPQEFDIIMFQTTGNDISGLIPTWKYMQSFRAGVYYAAITNDQKSYVASATTGGSWTTATTSGYGLAHKYSTDSGAYIESQFVGKWLVLGQEISQLGGTYTVHINGVLYGTYDANMGGAMGSAGSVVITPSARRFGPFAADTNTFRVTNIEQGSRTYLSWWYSKGDERLPGPTIIANGCFSRPAYSQEKEDLCVDYSDSTVALYNEMREMGLNVDGYTDPSRLPGDAYYIDGIHLNGLGATEYAEGQMPYLTNSTVQRLANMVVALPVIKERTGTGDTTVQNIDPDLYSGRLHGTWTIDTAIISTVIANDTNSYKENMRADTLAVTNVATFDYVTASTPAAFDASKKMVTATVTGTGTTVVLSASPTLTGTLTGSKASFSDSIVTSRALKVVGTTASTPLTLSTSNTSTAATSVENTSVPQIWSHGVVGSAASLGAAGAYYWRDATIGVTRMQLTSAGVLNVAGLAGTGTRITTSTSTGNQTNATSIDGAYTWAGAAVFSSTVAANGALTVTTTGSTPISLSSSNTTQASLSITNSSSSQIWNVGVSGSGASIGPAGSFLFRDASIGFTSVYFTTAGNGVFSGSLTTAAPTTGTAAPWKMGVIVTAACVLDATTYVQLDVNGTFVKVARCQ